jgi:hypothetical protein
MSYLLLPIVCRACPSSCPTAWGLVAWGLLTGQVSLQIYVNSLSTTHTSVLLLLLTVLPFRTGLSAYLLLIYRKWFDRLIYIQLDLYHVLTVPSELSLGPFSRCCTCELCAVSISDPNTFCAFSSPNA